MNESGFFDNNVFPASMEKGFSDIVLLKATSYALIYRMSNQGKYFLFKVSNATKRSEDILEREFDISKGCDHPHMPHLIMLGEIEGIGKGILMEYIEGRTLSDYLIENPSLKSRQRIFSELIDTVGYLHKRGIVHNDLKPENILISRSGDSLKLIDFGLSDDDAHYLYKTPGLTLSFAAPELAGERKSDVRSDIYSLGKIMKVIFGKRYSSISGKSLNHNPEKRFSCADELKKKWENRNRMRNISLISIFTLFALSPLALYVGERNSQQRKIEDLNLLLESQREKIDSQKNAFRNLSVSHQNIKDTLDLTRRSALDHAKERQAKINAFADGLSRMFRTTMDSVNRCGNRIDANQYLVNYSNKAREYYYSFDKNVEGEDLSNELFALMLAQIEKDFKATKDIFEKLPYK